MKRSSAPLSRRRSRLAMAAAIVVVVSVVALGAALAFRIGGQPWAPVWLYDQAARQGSAPSQSAEELKSQINREVEEGMLAISIASAIDFATPGASGKAWIENPAGNRYDVKVSIVLDEDGQEVYASGALAPGSYVEDVELARQLPPGQHEATAEFRAFDRETHEQAGQAAARIVLVVGEE